MTSRERAAQCWSRMSLGNIARPGNSEMATQEIQRAIDEAVAEAVKAERERCKAVAIHHADWWEKQPSDTEYNRALRDFSQAEAYAIALNIGAK